MFENCIQNLDMRLFYHQLKRITLCCTILLATVFALSAQNRVEVWIDTNQITIGDQAHLYLKIMSAPGSQVHFDLSAWEDLPGLEVTGQKTWDTLQQSSDVVIQKAYTVTSFDSGDYVIPSLVVRFEQGQGTPTEITTTELPFKVQNPPVANLGPIRDIVKESLKWEDFMPFIIGGILFLLVIYGISRWLNREKKVAPPPPVPEIPLSEQALQQLEALRQKQLWQNGHIKEYETELTFIIRNFLKQQYEVPALEATTGELIQLLQDKNFDPAKLAQLRSVLEIADLVKFAKVVPENNLYDQALETAKAMVNG